MRDSIVYRLLAVSVIVVALLLMHFMREPAKPPLPSQHFVVKPGTKALIGQPAHYPTEMVDALKRLFAEHPDVRRAWIVLIQEPDRVRPPHTLITIELTGDFRRLGNEIGGTLSNVHIPDPPVDVHPIADRRELLGHFPATIKPFYERI